MIGQANNMNDGEMNDFLCRLESEGYISISDVTGELRLNGIDMNKIKIEYVVYQDAPITGALTSRTLRKADVEEPIIDNAVVVKIGDQFNIGDNG